MIDPINLIITSIQFDTQRLNTIAGNAANALTPGYKREFLSIDGEFQTLMNSQLNAQPILSARVDHKPGVQRLTSNPLDLAILGQGYFQINTDQGHAYTRQGAFRLDEQGRLVTHLGQAVSGASGDIYLTGPNPLIDHKGQVIENGKVVAQVKVISVDHDDDLVKVGGGLFKATENAVIRDVDSPNIAQGNLEGSNVDSTQEMVRLMETFRHFETSHKIVQAYDELNDKTLKNLSQF
ncbi:flagellar hook-basal body protein [Methylophilaceae bacterium 11]|nr:flagellar hook-basal body protein [Methylophilaceae bacterium 11]